jgi:pimeloyl-ACP methyl ester carboxylesterase
MSEPGAQPPVVLIHGLATSAQRTWTETGWVDLLSDIGREVVVIDLPGHGGTPLLADDEWDDLESWVLARLPGGQVDAIGFSMGAKVLLGLAGREPDRFRKLVVAGVGGNLFRRDGSHESLASGVAGDEAGAENPVVQHFLKLAESSGTDPAAIVSLIRRSSPRLEELLPHLTAETLVVIGDQDFALPAEPLMEKLPTSARLVVLRGVDHFATPKAMGFLDAGLDFLT